jgi:chromosome segregation protein
VRAAVRLRAIELESFRGFAEAQSFDLDADVVLVRGDNGSGKTSLVDGLLWLLTGGLSRLRDRAKGLRRGHDGVVNLYTGSPARVRLKLALDGGRVVDFERRGTAAKSELSAWEDETALDHPAELLARALGDLTEEQLPEAVETWGVLQQHALAAALGGGVMLHQRMSAVLGLERLTLFTDSTARVVKSLAVDRKRLESTRDDLCVRHRKAKETFAAVQAAAKEPDAVSQLIASRLREIAGELPSDVTLKDSPSDLEAIASLGRAIGLLIDAARDVVQRHVEATAAKNAVTVAVDQVEAELARLTARAKEAVQRAPVRIQLASAALDLLGDHCPVCGQAIEEESVRRHMLELLEASQVESQAAADMQSAVTDAQARLLKAREAERLRTHTVGGRDAAVRRLRQVLESTGALRIDEVLLSPDEAGTLVERMEYLQARTRDLFLEAQRLESGQVTRFQSEAERLGVEVAQAESDLLDMKARCERAVALDEAAHKAADRIVKRALKRIEPSFAEVFDRLAPHPTFTELRTKQDIFYKKNQIVPEVYDGERDLSANPELIFSEGQRNVVALSYFLGLALNARGGALPFLVLDDPLQTMDILGVLGFADMCRRIREHRQILVTTHDRRFATLLGRKLAPREAGYRTIMHEFDGWTREGPRISWTDEPVAEIVPLLRKEAS